MDKNTPIIIEHESSLVPAVRASFGATIKDWFKEQRARRAHTINYKEVRTDDNWTGYGMEQIGTQIRTLQFPRVKFKKDFFDDEHRPEIYVDYAHLEYRPGYFHEGKWERGEWEFMPTTANIGGFSKFGFGGGGPGWNGSELRCFSTLEEGLKALKDWEANKLNDYYPNGFEAGPYFKSLKDMMAELVQEMHNADQDDGASLSACIAKWHKKYDGIEKVTPEELAESASKDPLCGRNTSRDKKSWVHWREVAEQYGLGPKIGIAAEKNRVAAPALRAS